MAADPRDPRHLVAAWMQDRAGSDVDGAQGLGTAVSRDGAKSWFAARLRGLTGCDGGAAQHSAVNEAQVAIGGEGTVYVTGELHLGSARVPFVARSTDGGARWSAPTILSPTDQLAGQESITADPLRPGHAYVSWQRVEPHPLGPLFATAVLYMSESADAGAHWSPPREVRRPGTGLYDVAPRVMHPRDGSLVVVYVEQSASSFSGRVARIPIRSVRSTDDGTTWSRPIHVGSIEAGGTVDPDSGAIVNRFPRETTAQAPDGTLYVAWRNGTSTNASRIDVARSRDGGRSWARLPGAARLGTQTFLPQIAVARNGVVGLTYYDFRGDRPGDGELTTRLWFASSPDRGTSWHEEALAGPFDTRRTLRGDGSLIGDTGGLVGGKQGFVATFNLGPPLASNGLSDLFSARIERCSVLLSSGSCDPPLRLSRLRIRPRSIRHGRRARLSLRLSRAAGVAAVVERRRTGSRRGRRCVALRRRGRRCTRFARKRVLSIDGRAGRNSLSVATRRLPRGRYRIRVRAVDAIGSRSPERRLRFRVR